MSAETFFDSNILLYLLSAETNKAARADELLAAGGVVSVQVLNEFANVAIKKHAIDFAEIREIVAAVRTLCAVRPVDLETHELGLDISERYKFSIYDSMLLAAAQQAGCTTFYSEDMSHGQKIGNLTIRNPFRT